MLHFVIYDLVSLFILLLLCLSSWRIKDWYKDDDALSEYAEIVAMSK